MKTFETLIKAIDPHDGEIKTFKGNAISAKSKEEARKYCDNNGLGFLHISDEIVASYDFDRNKIWKDNYLN